MLAYGVAPIREGQGDPRPDQPEAPTPRVVPLYTARRPRAAAKDSRAEGRPAVLLPKESQWRTSSRRHAAPREVRAWGRGKSARRTQWPAAWRLTPARRAISAWLTRSTSGRSGISMSMSSARASPASLSARPSRSSIGAYIRTDAMASRSRRLQAGSVSPCAAAPGTAGHVPTHTPPGVRSNRTPTRVIVLPLRGSEGMFFCPCRPDGASTRAASPRTASRRRARPPCAGPFVKTVCPFPCLANHPAARKARFTSRLPTAGYSVNLMPPMTGCQGFLDIALGEKGQARIRHRHGGCGGPAG